MLPEREQQGRYSCAKPNFPPPHGVIREYFEHQGEQHGRETKRERQVCDVQDRCKPGIQSR